MTKQLIEGAAPYCLWTVQHQGYVYTRCDMDYHERVEAVRDLTTCSMCERPIKWDDPHGFRENPPPRYDPPEQVQYWHTYMKMGDRS